MAPNPAQRAIARTSLTVAGTTPRMASTDNTCGIRVSDSAISCWGSLDVDLNPTPAGAFKEVSLFNAACAIRQENDTVVCWSPGAGEGPIRPPDRPFLHVSVGPFTACGVEVDGRGTCWGADLLGEGRPPEGAFTAIAAGRSFSCGLRPSGLVVCWGARTWPDDPRPTR